MFRAIWSGVDSVIECPVAGAKSSVTEDDATSDRPQTFCRMTISVTGGDVSR